MEQPSWTPCAPGVWTIRHGSPDAVTLLKAAGTRPQHEALQRLGTPLLPAPCPEARLRTVGQRTVVTLSKRLEEALFGLGLNFKQLGINQTVRDLHVDHYSGQDNGRTHAPVPFYLSDAGYGVLVDCARYLNVNAGGAHPVADPPPECDRLEPGWEAVRPGRTVEFSTTAEAFDLYLFAGASLREVVQRFNLFCGGGCLPPKWGLGFWYRVPIRFTDSDARTLVAEFAARDFPLDVLGLEPGWHSQSYPCTYEWHAQRFPDPAAFVAELKAQGIHLNLWENACVSPASATGRALAAGGLCGDYAAGWGGLIPDLSLPEARRIWGENHRSRHLAIGVDGYKLDECDGFDQWVWPDHATFPSGLDGEQARQLYGVWFQRFTDGLFRAAGRRTYGLVRGSNAGAQRFAYAIYNDHYDHRDFITALCAGSLCGVLWTPEARASDNADDWLRRLQTTCCSPLALLNAWASDTQLWSFPEVMEEVREILQLRLRLLPYLYSAFARYRFEGLPPFRAMLLEPGFADPAAGSAAAPGVLDGTKNPYSLAARREVKDQYMMGDAILVAPLFAGETQRRIVFPAGTWHDFHTGAEVTGGPVVTWTPADRRIPLFVKAGAIIPLLPPVNNLTRAGATRQTLEIRHYGNAPGCFTLYDDDGESFAYETNGGHRVELKVWRDATTGQWRHAPDDATLRDALPAYAGAVWHPAWQAP